jgi:hypothetical protein
MESRSYSRLEHHRAVARRAFEQWQFHLSGFRVYQDLRITSGLPVIRPQSPPALILFTASCLRGIGQSLTPHRHRGNTL